MRFIQFKIYSSICLPVFIYVCVRVAIYYFGFPVFIDTIEGTNKRTNERTDGQLFLILYTHRFARVQYSNNKGVAFMITFLLLIAYVYLKTE